jgi:hypothetical protein
VYELIVRGILTYHEAITPSSNALSFLERKRSRRNVFSRVYVAVVNPCRLPVSLRRTAPRIRKIVVRIRQTQAIVLLI